MSRASPGRVECDPKAWEFVSEFPENEKGKFGRRIASSKWQSSLNSPPAHGPSLPRAPAPSRATPNPAKRPYSSPDIQFEAWSPNGVSSVPTSPFASASPTLPELPTLRAPQLNSLHAASSSLRGTSAPHLPKTPQPTRAPPHHWAPHANGAPSSPQKRSRQRPATFHPYSNTHAERSSRRATPPPGAYPKIESPSWHPSATAPSLAMAYSPPATSLHASASGHAGGPRNGESPLRTSNEMIAFTNLHVGTPTMSDSGPYGGHALSPLDPGSSPHEWDPSFSHLNGDEVLSNWESATAWVREAEAPLPRTPPAQPSYSPHLHYSDSGHLSPYSHASHAPYHGHDS